MEDAKQLIAEKAAGVLPRLRRGELSLVLKSLWELEIRDPILVDALLPLYDLEERFGLMPTLLKLIALQDEPKGRTFLCSLGEDVSSYSIDRSFLSEALSVLAKRGVLTTKDHVGVMALQRIRDSREKSIDAFARPLLIGGNADNVQEVRAAFLDPSSKLRTHQNAQLGASLLAYDDAYLATCAGSFSSFGSQGQVRVLRSLHLATGPLADDLDKRLNDCTSQVSTILQLALKQSDRDVRLEACRVVTSKPEQLTEELKPALHQLAVGDPDESVRRAAAHALNSK